MTLYRPIFVIVPTHANLSSKIKSKYQRLVTNYPSRFCLSPKIIYSFFPLTLLFSSANFLIIRDSLSIYPFIFLLFLLRRKFLFELNGDPIASLALPGSIRSFLLHLKKILISFNPNCSVLTYSAAEAKRLSCTKFRLVANLFPIDPVKTRLPRSRNVLVLIGFDSPYHGLSDIYHIASYLPDYNFYLYGASLNVLPTNNIFILPSTPLASIVKDTNYGYAISSLRYDLKGYHVSDNSTLKGVTYLALDLPFVTSYTENYAPIESYLQLPVSTISLLHDDAANQIRKFFQFYQDKHLTLESSYFQSSFYWQSFLALTVHE